MRVILDQMKKLILLLLASATLGLTGCTNLPKALAALAKDTNSIDLLVTAPGYSISLKRNIRANVPIILQTTGTVPSLAPGGTNFIVLPQ